MVELLADHPDWEELAAYSQGRLDEPSLLTVEEHLTHCMKCCELLETVPGDSFLSRLREADTPLPGTPGPSPHRPESATIGPGAIPPELVDHPRYRVLGLVAEGGMGAVYRAVHRRMKRVVALKVIRPDLLGHPSAVPRFLQEAQAAARLHHRHIVTSYDADQAGRLHFLVMEYVEGRNLADYLAAHGPLPAAEACAYTRQAALGLQHAHEQGMVHRDIKPHNLMLQTGDKASEGVIKILDFGLARLPRTVESRAAGVVVAGSLTGTGTVMGTADYIAPEQAADPRRADIRADIYALGCTLFHLLTGRPPFPDGTVAEKLARHADTPLPSVIALRPETPPGLAAVLARMTAKAPADRYSTPAEVAEALAPFCPAPDGQQPLAGKRRRWLAAGLALSGVLLAGAVVWRLGGHRAHPTPAVEENKPETIVESPQAVIESPELGVKNSEPIVQEKADPTVDSTEEEAIRTVQRLGGQITRSDKAPGRPIVSVSLANTWATDADLRKLTVFRSLRALKLDHTKITNEGLACLAELLRLNELSLTGTRVSDAGMKHIAAVNHLRSLTLSHTAVRDGGIKQLAELKQLSTLRLEGPQLTDAATTVLGGLTKLSVLHLSRTSITDAGLRNLAGLSGMTILTLNQSRAIGDEGMKTVAQFKRLMALDLAGTRVTDRGLQELAGLTKLSSLQLGNLRVTDAGARTLGDLKTLRMLTLGNTEITDAGLKDVVRNRRLMMLDLQGLDSLTDAGLMELRGLPELKHLVLAQTKVSEAAMAELRKALPNLRIQR